MPALSKLRLKGNAYSVVKLAIIADEYFGGLSGLVAGEEPDGCPAVDRVPERNPHGLDDIIALPVAIILTHLYPVVGLN
jgi:hypothetical protein